MNLNSGNYRCSDTGQRVQLAIVNNAQLTIEKSLVNLWEKVLVGVHRDIVRGGEGSSAYKEAVDAEDELEHVASLLGCRRGFVTMMIDEAVEEHRRRQAKRREYDQERDWSKKSNCGKPSTGI